MIRQYFVKYVKGKLEHFYLGSLGTILPQAKGINEQCRQTYFQHISKYTKFKLKTFNSTAAVPFQVVERKTLKKIIVYIEFTLFPPSYREKKTWWYFLIGDVASEVSHKKTF